MKKIEIDKVEHFSRGVLEEMLRLTPMLNAPDIKPYKDAHIQLVKMNPLNCHPAQRYVLKDNLERTRELDWALQSIGIDMFNLEGFIRIWHVGMDEPMDLLPPLIEMESTKGYDVRIVADGMHRMYHAMLSWKEPVCMVIRKAATPYYAHPIPGCYPWDKVEILENLHPGVIKKWHRFPNNKDYYRNFDACFMNVGGPRGNGTKTLGVTDPMPFTDPFWQRRAVMATGDMGSNSFKKEYMTDPTNYSLTGVDLATGKDRSVAISTKKDCIGTLHGDGPQPEGFDISPPTLTHDHNYSPSSVKEGLMGPGGLRLSGEEE